MKELLREASEACGASEEEVRGALGVLLGFLQDCCEAGSMERLKREAPELAPLVPPPRSRGFFGAMLGGNAALLKLPGELAAVGIGRDQIPRMLPVVLRWLKARVSPELWAEIEGQLPSMLTRG